MSRFSVLPLVALCLGASLLLLGKTGNSSGTPRVSADNAANKSAAAEPQAPASHAPASRAEIPALAPDLMAAERIRRAAEVKIRKSLQTRVSVKFENEPLNSAIGKLAKLADAPLWLDMAALSEDGIATNERINGNFKDLTVRQILNLVSEPLGLTWLIEDETLKITTQLIAEEMLFTRTFDVQRLLEIGDELDADKRRDPLGNFGWNGRDVFGQSGGGSGFFCRQ